MNVQVQDRPLLLRRDLLYTPRRKVETCLSVLRYVVSRAVDSVLTCLLYQPLLLSNPLVDRLEIPSGSTERVHDGGGLTLVFTFYTPLETVCWFTEYVLVYLSMYELESWNQAVFSLWFLDISLVLQICGG